MWWENWEKWFKFIQWNIKITILKRRLDDFMSTWFLLARLVVRFLIITKRWILSLMNQYFDMREVKNKPITDFHSLAFWNTDSYRQIICFPESIYRSWKSMSISLVSEPCAYNLKINERNHWRTGNEVYRSTRLGHVTYIMCLVLRASESATIITVFCGGRSVDSWKNENYLIIILD